MEAAVEQRGAPRVEAQYKVEFSVAGRCSYGVGRAVDLSETGLRFIAETSVEPGSYLTVRVPPRAAGLPALTRLAAVVRCLRLADGSGYAIGCAYD